MACRMLVTGERVAYKAEFAIVSTSLENEGSEEMRSPSLRIDTSSLLVSWRTRMAIWGKEGIRRLAQGILAARSLGESISTVWSSLRSASRQTDDQDKLY